ncbi:hypothetical protein WL34_01715 [Burkholderia cepacia]|nr:hypothetical protein WL34_01715 [Burkholderia cepacia]
MDSIAWSRRTPSFPPQAIKGQRVEYLRVAIQDTPGLVVTGQFTTPGAVFREHPRVVQTRLLI